MFELTTFQLWCLIVAIILFLCAMILPIDGTKWFRMPVGEVLLALIAGYLLSNAFPLGGFVTTARDVQKPAGGLTLAPIPAPANVKFVSGTVTVDGPVPTGYQLQLRFELNGAQQHLLLGPVITGTIDVSATKVEARWHSDDGSKVTPWSPSS